MSEFVCALCNQLVPDWVSQCGHCETVVEDEPEHDAPQPTDGLGANPAVELLTQMKTHMPGVVRLTPINTLFPGVQPARMVAPGHAAPLAAPAPLFARPIEIAAGSPDNFYCRFEPRLRSGGIFVATDTPAAIGTLIQVSFRLPGWSTHQRAVGRVQWIRAYLPGHVETTPGMGLALGELPPGVEAAIDSFLTHHEAIFFDDVPLEARGL